MKMDYCWDCCYYFVQSVFCIDSFFIQQIGVGLNSFRHYAFNGDYGVIMVRPLSWNIQRVDVGKELNPYIDEYRHLYLSKRQAFTPMMNSMLTDLVKKYSGKPYNLFKFWQIMKAGRNSLSPLARMFLHKNSQDNTDSLFCSQLGLFSC